MKKLNSLNFLTILAFGLLFSIAGCKKDKTPDRDKFIGLYSAIETCTSGNYSYNVTVIESGSSDDAIVLTNLYDLDANLTATVDGDNLTIASQVDGGLTYSGTGNINDNTLTINFTVTAGTDSDVCNVICTRQ